MTRIVWTLQAIEDVEAIRSYIARDSSHYAALTAERIVDSVERLKEFPRSGRVVPELEREAYREVILGTYHIVYRHRRRPSRNPHSCSFRPSAPGSWGRGLIG